MAISVRPRLLNPTQGDPDTQSGREESRRERERSEARRLEFTMRMTEARDAFGRREIGATLEALEAASALFGGHPEVLNLRGACHVELREFERALDAFTAASEREPNNAAIQFNIAEIHFVTRRWKDAIPAFERARDGLAPGAARDLADFKIMLCHSGLGNLDDFHRAAEELGAKAGPIAVYVDVAKAYQAGDADTAREALTEAARRFPDAAERAAWLDTLMEFGYAPPG